MLPLSITAIISFESLLLFFARWGRSSYFLFSCLTENILLYWILPRFERNTSVTNESWIDTKERKKRIQLVTKKKENIGHDSWLIRAVELSIRVVYETFNQFNDTARNWCLQRNMPIFDLEFAFDHSRLPCFLLLLPILRIIKLFSSMVPLCTVAIPTDRKIPHRNNV